MATRFLSLLLKECIQFFRDRTILILILFLFTGENVMCTLALSFDVKHLAIAIVDEDGTPQSRALTETFLIAKEFKMAGMPGNVAQATQWLQSGRTMMALVIPKGFTGALAREDKAAVQVLLDGTNSNTAAIARGYTLRVLDLFERTRLRKDEAAEPMIEPVLRVWYNPDLTFNSFMVLSMIALAAMLVGVIQPAASIVREKEVGTIEQLMVTPITTLELFIAKTLPTLFTGVLALFPSLLIVFAFDVPMRGSMGLLVALTALFLLSAIGLGVLIAAVTRTLQQALLLSFFGLMPTMFLSGTLVPIESMPRPLQLLSLLSPLRYYMDIILGIFLKGAGMAELWPQAVILTIFGMVLFGTAMTVFARR